MAVKTLSIPYPEELPATLGATPEAFEHELCFLVAAKLYELGRVSSGHAAVMAGVSRAEFLTTLGHYQIAVWNYDLEELDHDIQEAQARARRAL